MENKEILKKESLNTFWKEGKNGKIEIVQIDLIKFLEKAGYCKAANDNGYEIVRKEKNILYKLKGEYELVDLCKDYLVKNNELPVLETFSRGVSNYLSTKKLEFLPTIEYISDRDSKDEALYYFKNTAVKVTAHEIELVPYKNLGSCIWSSSIIQRDFSLNQEQTSGFNTFLKNLAGGDPIRLESLKTAIGYLNHRYQDPSNRKAVILMDQNISFNGRTNGGSGKTLLIQAIGKVRNLVTIDGKNVKEKSWFKNQRIDRDSDIVFYDDVSKDFNFEGLYSMITGDIPVEQKRKDEFVIKAEDAPKIVISSNYVVKGPGGSSDERRRWEFEVANHFHSNYQPVDEFGFRFFDDWDEKQWNEFDTLMMECTQLYLQKGLIKANPINLQSNRLINVTSPGFIEFVNSDIQLDNWFDKRDIIEKFKLKYPELNQISSNLFTKWLKEYAAQKNLQYQDRSSGGKYLFILKTVNKTGDEE